MRNIVLCTGIIVAAIILSGCGAIPAKTSTNLPISPEDMVEKQASFVPRSVCPDQIADPKKTGCNPTKKNEKVLVLLALSGGGSRAALFSTLSMLEMQDMKVMNGASDLLSEVDLISSVSGGSLAAGYYVLSGNSSQNDRRPWGKSLDEKTNVINVMKNNYVLRWFGNWFWPDNIALFWLTDYDRSDIMAQTLADNLFDRPSTGQDFKFFDLNPARPNIVLNATKGSGIGAPTFGQPFTFTKEDFSTQICSSIDEYSVARGVMATATFPGVFNFMTLTNHCPKNKEPYVHVFDGGNADNLGLTSIKRTIWELARNNKLDNINKILVISIDAFTDSNGVDEYNRDPRHWYDYIVDTDFIIATDSLLVKNRENLIRQFSNEIPLFPYDDPTNSALMKECSHFLSLSFNGAEEAKQYCENSVEFWRKVNSIISNPARNSSKLQFVHISFNDLPDGELKNRLNRIKTDFKIADEDVTALTCAAPVLFGKDLPDGCESYQFDPVKSEKALRDIRDKWSSNIHDLY